jgi:hypothetical protein
MKKIFSLKTVLILSLVLIFFSCANNKENWIVGKWIFNGFQPNDTSKLKGVALAAFAFANVASDSSTIEFNKDKTVKISSKQGKTVNEGNYQLAGDTLITLTYKNNQKKEEKIKRESDDAFSFIASQGSATVSFRKIINSEIK